MAQQEQVEQLVKKGVTKWSGKGYSTKWRLWLEFLQGLYEGQNPGEDLERLTGDEQRAQWLQLFIVFLREEKNMKGEQKVGAILTALKYEWHQRGVSCEFVSSSLVRAAKKGTRLTNGEVREAAKKYREKDTLPLTSDMVVEARKLFWENQP